MAARLAPGESQPVRVLLNLVAPARNHGHNRIGTVLLKGQKPTGQEFNELADAASPDSLVARGFELDAERFVRGDHSGGAALKTTLASWRDNHDRSAVVAKGNPQLEAAFPISADTSPRLQGSVWMHSQRSKAAMRRTPIGAGAQRNSSIARPRPKRLQKAPCRFLPRNNNHPPTFWSALRRASASFWKLQWVFDHSTRRQGTRVFHSLRP